MKYLLPKELGGLEVVFSAKGYEEGCVVVEVLEGSARGLRIEIPEDSLTRIPPPIPTEPSPGAYLIGGRLFVRFEGRAEVWDRWLWPVPLDAKDSTEWDGWGSGPWTAVCEIVGPDMEVRPLVALPSVELPWWGSNVGGIREMVGVEVDHGEIAVKVDGTPAWVSKATAREMAAALWTAAGEP